MRILALALASAPILLGTPRTVAAEGNCPRFWQLAIVPVGFPGDQNQNGIVCYREFGNPHDDFVTYFIRDDH
jgi:hypothetical protein